MQLHLPLPSPRNWGGRRSGAGRKPKGPRAGPSHGARAPLSHHHPAHVTLRLRAGLPNLRTPRLLRLLQGVLRAAQARHGCRLIHFSVQSNHLHLLIEAQHRPALSRGIGALSIRLARRLNRTWGRSGPVFAERFHARALKSPKEVRHALAYVLLNARHHAPRPATAPRIDPCTSGPWFDGWRGHRIEPPPEPPVVAPRTWLLRHGWRRHGLVDAGEIPGTRSR